MASKQPQLLLLQRVESYASWAGLTRVGARLRVLDPGPRLLGPGRAE